VADYTSRLQSSVQGRLSDFVIPQDRQNVSVVIVGDPRLHAEQRLHREAVQRGYDARDAYLRGTFGS
jgi:hypothetical protein